MKKNAERHKELVEQIHETYLAKNMDYGDSFNKSLNKYGMIAAIIRMNDKFERIDNLRLSDGRVTDEAVVDSLLDLANYAIMTAMWVEEERWDDSNGDGGYKFYPPKGDVYLFDTGGYDDVDYRGGLVNGLK